MEAFKAFVFEDENGARRIYCDSAVGAVAGPSADMKLISVLSTPSPIFAWAFRRVATYSDDWRLCEARPNVLDESAWEILALSVAPNVRAERPQTAAPQPE